MIRSNRSFHVFRRLALTTTLGGSLLAWYAQYVKGEAPVAAKPAN